MQKNIALLLSEIETITNAFGIIESQNGGNFNIFSILKMETDEVATHSRFIAELINKDGTHGQKDTFLKLFIQHFLDKNFEFNTEKSLTEVEYSIGNINQTEGGRIDILLRDNRDNVIMIENKIYAPEQPNQLLRYRNAFKNGELLYLTLYGSESNENNEEVKYRKLSYKYDIVRWLVACKKEAIDHPILRETLNQYLNLIKKLTGLNSNSAMTNEIVKTILRNRESVMAFSALLDVENDIQKSMISEIVNKTRKHLEKKYEFEIESINFDANKGLLLSIETEKMKAKNFKIQFNFENSNFENLIFGFINKDKTLHQNESLLELAKEHYHLARQSAWWNVYIPFEKYRNWNYNTLSQIYFEKNDEFIKDVEVSTIKLIDIFEKKFYTKNSQ